MANRRELDIDLADDDPNGIASATDSSVAGSLSLDGDLVIGTDTFWRALDIGVARIIEITDTATVDQSGATLTITGTDENGTRTTEDVTGPGSGATVKSVKAYYEITDVTIASPAGGAPTLDIGPANETLSGLRIIPLNPYSLTNPRIHVDVTGTINFTIQETYDGIGNLSNAVWVDITAFADKTADTTNSSTLGISTLGATALRIEINSYTDGAELQVSIIQRRSGAF